MNKDEFEQKFKDGATWAQAHGKVTLGVACFVIGWILGKFV